MPDPTIITSPLSGPFTEGDVTVNVQIYRLQDTKWSLEVVHSKGTSTVWDDLFDTDAAAKAEFHRAISEEGLGGIGTAVGYLKCAGTSWGFRCIPGSRAMTA
jgi:hypothetical protein